MFFFLFPKSGHIIEKGFGVFFMLQPPFFIIKEARPRPYAVAPPGTSCLQHKPSPKQVVFSGVLE